MKSSKSTQIRIVNPIPGEAAFTSRRSAKDLLKRGRYIEVPRGIKRLEEWELREERQASKDRLTDEAYWDAVARQRGGSADQLHFIIRKSATKPTMPGGPEGAAIMAFIPVIVR